MGLDRITVVTAAVFAGQGSAVKIDDAVLFPALLFQIPGWNDPHCTDTSALIVFQKEIIYGRELYVNEGIEPYILCFLLK